MSRLDDKDALARIQAATDYPLERTADGWVVGHFFDSRLASAYQPVFDLVERRIVGHAVYVRCGPAPREKSAASAALGVFALATDDPLLVRLDRLCRTVHALNYFERAPDSLALHLAVQARLLESVKDGHGRAFERVLDLIGVETSRVVIEIPPELNRDRRLFRHVTMNYRSRGYRIAFTHGGPADDWTAELGSLYPDIVRVSPTALRHANARNVADSAHRLGAVILASGVESEQDVTAAVRAGADLLQGHYLAEPGRNVAGVSKQALRWLQHQGCAW
ncbi:MAG TPA: EAL domain-containing protein [Burkholderiales bacterium]|nr:EAL domain-containing protein [Burkholderiales bacterium]